MFLLKFQWSLFPRVSIGSVNGLVQYRWQVITWANVDQDVRDHLALLDHNELTYFSLCNLVTFLKYNKQTQFHKWILVNSLTDWGRVTHICVSKLTIIGPDNGLTPSIIGPDNGLSPRRRQAIIWTSGQTILLIDQSIDRNSFDRSSIGLKSKDRSFGKFS